MEEPLPEGFTALAFPSSHRRFLRAANGLERLHQEIKRRIRRSNEGTRVVRIFPGESSCLRLLSALWMETVEEGRTDKAYRAFSS
jgi:transposase-like protein